MLFFAKASLHLILQQKLSLNSFKSSELSRLKVEREEMEIGSW